jgi:hypothetical protein
MRFSTKVDLWILLLLTLVPLGALAAVLATKDTLVLLIVVVAWTAIGFVLLPCDYTLEEERLVVRSGLVKWRIPYRDIRRVYPTRNPLSSPAWSLDRIAIVYGKACVMVSPKDKVGFATELMRRAGLKPNGEELVREGA